MVVTSLFKESPRLTKVNGPLFCFATAVVVLSLTGGLYLGQAEAPTVEREQVKVSSSCKTTLKINEHLRTTVTAHKSQIESLKKQLLIERGRNSPSMIIKQRNKQEIEV